ncbi:DUF6088 family protein [Mycoplasma mycoides]|uniref:PF13338 domain protein n=1 Tax=Mycoplasma mycoides subsp. capri TaxID=40477 RepID=A0AB38GEJ5_MYCMC|nr:DUF6088 family protein [Mycoplasma mycoides]ADH21870.1 conserved hypothetical protein [synthetic Mycoplasma mycoides JCVI-syn1.0]AMW76644.1 hypothetical protein JCVISYN3_0730 [synthetic bacterium JCVI-Syn3.0]AMW77117.1 hypothetical protein JCVISYN2_0730 [synthetic bacterium JCVI-Syn2.0]AVX54944.1 Uncharacterized protein JCVISYN3A_0730 [synthetic bacterium JCVI-Syn3A]QWN46180.1 hypothetical protein JOY38_02090 [synthetic bacterium JCVI-Syn3B]
MSYLSQIQNRIDHFEPTKIFISNDFLDIASNETVRRTLNKLVEEEKIKRIINGFYYNPTYIELIHEYEPFEVEELAYSIARKYNWEIAPFGIACLNILGLSTQVPAKIIFVSSGKNKIYNIDGWIIEFKKVSNKEICNMSWKTKIVIQAIKEIGKNKLTKKDIRIIRNSLSALEKQNLLKETKYTTTWIFDYIKQICKE